LTFSFSEQAPEDAYVS